MERDKVIEQVKKILAKTTDNGATPEEAATAVALAQKLMASHGIFMSEVECKQDKEQVVELQGTFGTKSVSDFQGILASRLASHFGCVVLVRGLPTYGQSLCFIGEETKALLFKEVFTFAYNSYQSAFKAWLKGFMDSRINLLGIFANVDLSRKDKIQYRWDYFNGFINGLTNELIKSENEMALVVVPSDDVNNYVNRITRSHKTISNREIKSALANSAGYKDGSFAMRTRGKVLHE